MFNIRVRVRVRIRVRVRVCLIKIIFRSCTIGAYILLTQTPILQPFMNIH